MAYGKWQGALKMDATDGAASTTDYSTSVLSLTLNIERNSAQYHTLGSRTQYSLTGGDMVALTMTVIADSALATVLRGWTTAATRTIEIGQPDLATAGSNKIAFEAMMGSRSNAYMIEAGSADVHVMDVTLHPTGTVTETAVI